MGEESEDAETVLGTSYKHMYYLRSRFAENSFLPLSVASGMAGVHGITFPFGHFQREEFIIIRDKDLKQVFHLDSAGVSVCGPSDIKDLGHSSQFVIQGRQHTLATVQLSFRGGNATVRCQSQKSVVTFRSSVEEVVKEALTI